MQVVYVVIPCKVAILLRFRYIYCDDCDLNGDIVLQVLYASKKYLLPALSAKCNSFLEENIHPDNVCVIYEQCSLYDETDIVDKCRSFIETRTDDILASSTFVDLPRKETVCVCFRE